MKTMMDIEKILLNPNNPRQSINEEKLEELAVSIKKHGIVEPLVVVPYGDDYMLVAGERRLRAAKIVELTEVPVIIEDYTPEAQQEIMLIENLQRENLNPIEEAQAYKTLIGDFGHTQEALACNIGVSQSQIANRLRLLELPAELRENITRGIITAGHGKVVAGYIKQLPEETILRVTKAIVDESIPVAKVKAKIQTAIAREGHPLSKKRQDGPVFDIKSCKDCLHRVKGRLWEHYEEEPFCMDNPCWETKQKEAAAEKIKEEAEKAAAREKEEKEKQQQEAAEKKEKVAAQKAEIKEIIEETAAEVKAVEVNTENPVITKLIEESREMWVKDRAADRTDDCVVIEHESVIPLDVFIKHCRTKNKVCKDASSMPKQLGDSRVYIEEQGIYWRGYELYGGSETITVEGHTLKIENGNGHVVDELPTLPVYYRVKAKQSSGTKYVYQMLGIITPNRTIFVTGSGNVVMRKEIFTHWIELIKQLPVIPGGVSLDQSNVVEDDNDGRGEGGTGLEENTGLSDVTGQDEVNQGEEISQNQEPGQEEVNSQGEESGQGESESITSEYTAEDGREIVIHQKGPDQWGVYSKAEDGQLCRIVSPELPTVGTWEEAEQKLSKYAEKRGLQPLKKTA